MTDDGFASRLASACEHHEALPAIGRAEIYDLSMEFSPDMPVPNGSPGFNLFLIQRHDDLPRRPGGVGSAVEWYSMSGHTGTHIDALGHAAMDGALTGGVDARETAQKNGLTSLDVTALGVIVARGVMLDVAALDGERSLRAARVITEVEISEAAEKVGGIREGDVVLVRTGWIVNWLTRDVYLGYPDGVPGIGIEASDWLVAQGAVLVGSDTHALEAIVPGIVDRPVHGALLARHGVPIIENLNLEALAANARAEFLFVGNPVPLRGATGAPIRPIAFVAG
jgi:kynurenine formamidase